MNLQKPAFFTTTFQNEAQFLSFLKQENNAYSTFILERYGKQQTKQDGYQLHHIKPKHAGGTDDPFNLVWLSLEDHAQSHYLLFECYGNHFDFCAFCMMKNNKKAAYQALRQQILANMKAEKKGFWNSDVQRELAQRPKPRNPYARNLYVKAALERGFILQSNITNATVIIPPMECTSLREVVYLWLSHPELADRYYDQWVNTENKEKYSLYTGLTRCLTGHRDRKTGKAVYSVAGWRIAVILV
jgi:hypothetical protein